MTRPEAVSVTEVARWMGLESRWLQDLAESGQIPCVRRAGEYAVDPRDVQEWLRRRQPQQSDRLPVDTVTLRAVSHALAHGESLDAVCGRMLDRLLDLLSADAGAIFFPEGNHWVRPVAAKGLSDGRVETLCGIASWAMRSAEPLLLPDPQRTEVVGTQSDLGESRDTLCVPFVLEGRALGVLVLMRAFDASPFSERDVAVASALATELALSVERAHIHESFGREIARTSLAQRQLEAYARDFREVYMAERERSVQLAAALSELERTYLSTVRGLAVAVEAKDEYTSGHLRRVTEYGLTMMSLIEPERASDPQYEYGFLLHDVGKLGVPDGILRKRGPLSEWEWDIMRQHPGTGKRILEGIPFLEEATDIVYTHQERWDGMGYPEGLGGDEIPLGARVFAVADSFDAMTSDRPYRQALRIDDAIIELRKGSGSQFWPDAVEAFLTLPRGELEAIATGSGRWDPLRDA